MEREYFLDLIKPKPYLIFRDYKFKARLDSFMVIAKTLCPDFSITDENREIYEETVKYFAADQSCKYSLNKGLFVYGSIGVGKSLYFKIFHALNMASETRNDFKALTINNLIDGITSMGNEYWNKSGTTSGEFESFRRCSYSNSKHLFLDDLGQSSRTAHFYGDSIDVVIAFISRRYNEYTDNNVLTHFSTNLEPDEIRAEYGEFIASRLRQMCTPVRFAGTDKRK